MERRYQGWRGGDTGDGGGDTGDGGLILEMGGDTGGDGGSSGDAGDGEKRKAMGGGRIPAPSWAGGCRRHRRGRVCPFVRPSRCGRVNGARPLSPPHPGSSLGFSFQLLRIREVWERGGGEIPARSCGPVQATFPSPGIARTRPPPSFPPAAGKCRRSPPPQPPPPANVSQHKALFFRGLPTSWGRQAKPSEVQPREG